MSKTATIHHGNNWYFKLFLEKHCVLISDYYSSKNAVESRISKDFTDYKLT